MACSRRHGLLFPAILCLAELTLPLFFLGDTAFLGSVAGFEQGRLVFLQGAHPGKARFHEAQVHAIQHRVGGLAFPGRGPPLQHVPGALGQVGGDSKPLAEQRRQRVVSQMVGRGAIRAHPHVSQQVAVLAGFEQGIEPLRRLVRVAVVELMARVRVGCPLVGREKLEQVQQQPLLNRLAQALDLRDLAELLLDHLVELEALPLQLLVQDAIEGGPAPQPLRVIGLLPHPGQ